MGLSTRVAIGVFLLWVIKDYALYPLLKGSFVPGGTSAMEQMIGLKGVAKECIDPGGYIHVRGELWHAEIQPERDPIPAGSPVRVVDVNGTLLVVVADTAHESNSSG